MSHGEDKLGEKYLGGGGGGGGGGQQFVESKKKKNLIKGKKGNKIEEEQE